MGWTFCHREKGQSHLDFFRREFPGIEILAASGRGTVYLACRDSRANVFAYVILTKWNKSNQNFGYKEIDENCGPVDSKCPRAILEMLSPTENEYALAWRKRCWNYANRKRVVAQHGMVYHTKQPLHWKGFSHSDFRCEDTKRMIFSPVEFRDGQWLVCRGLVRISRNSFDELAEIVEFIETGTA